MKVDFHGQCSLWIGMLDWPFFSSQTGFPIFATEDCHCTGNKQGIACSRFEDPAGAWHDSASDDYTTERFFNWRDSKRKKWHAKSVPNDHEFIGLRRKNKSWMLGLLQGKCNACASWFGWRGWGLGLNCVNQPFAVIAFYRETTLCIFPASASLLEVSSSFRIGIF